MSPNGLNAPPAFAATTTLIHAGAMKPALPRPTVTTTAPSTNAVVRLSSTGERKKRHHARGPEERTERQSSGNQPRTKRRKQVALLQRVHIGHRREQKQQQLCIFEQIVSQEISRTFEAVLLPGEGDQYPGNGRRDDHGLRLAQLGKLFGDDEHISDYEHREGKQSEACPGQVGNCGIRCGERRQGSKQQQ